MAGSQCHRLHYNCIRRSNVLSIKTKYQLIIFFLNTDFFMVLMMAFLGVIVGTWNECTTHSTKVSSNLISNLLNYQFSLILCWLSYPFEHVFIHKFYLIFCKKTWYRYVIERKKKEIESCKKGKFAICVWSIAYSKIKSTLLAFPELYTFSCLFIFFEIFAGITL